MMQLWHHMQMTCNSCCTPPRFPERSSCWECLRYMCVCARERKRGTELAIKILSFDFSQFEPKCILKPLFMFYSCAVKLGHHAGRLWRGLKLSVDENLLLEQPCSSSRLWGKAWTGQCPGCPDLPSWSIPAYLEIKTGRQLKQVMRGLFTLSMRCVCASEPPEPLCHSAGWCDDTHRFVFFFPQNTHISDKQAELYWAMCSQLGAHSRLLIERYYLCVCVRPRMRVKPSNEVHNWENWWEFNDKTLSGSHLKRVSFHTDDRSCFLFFNLSVFI